MIHVTCSACAASFQARDELAGRRGKCPSCGAPIEVPTVDAAPAPAPEASGPRVGGSSPPVRSGSRSGSRRAGGSRRSKGGMGGAVAVIGIALAIAAGAWYLRGDEPGGKDAFSLGQTAATGAHWDEAIAWFEQVPVESTLYSLAQEHMQAAKEQRDASAAAASSKGANALYDAIKSIEKNYVLPEAPSGVKYKPYARYLLKRCRDFLERFPDDPRASELKQYDFKYAKVASLDTPASEVDLEAEITFRCLVPPATGAYAVCAAAIDEFAGRNADNADAVRRLRDKLQARTFDYWQNIHARMKRQGDLDPGKQNWQRVANETSKYLKAIEGLPGITPAVEATELYNRALAGG